MLHHSRLIALCLLLFSTPAWGQQKRSDPSPMVYLKLTESAQPPGTTIYALVKPQTGDAVVHELCRQAVLLAVRDLRTLVIRDEGMGDPEPDKSRKNCYFLNVKTRYVPGESLSIQIDDETLDKAKKLWSQEITLDKERSAILQVTEYLEEKSRTELEPIFRKELQGGKEAPASKPDFTAINKLMEEFAFLSQFEALRRLHGTHTSREAATLKALAQAYSQLALLVRYHWTHQCRVCQARCLLYGMRLLALHPKEAGKSVFAACLGLTGYHSAALKCFEKADNVGEKESPWTASARLAVHFDYESLEARGSKEDEPCTELSLFLAFRILAREPTVLQGVSVPALRVGMKLFEKRPEAYPVIHRLSMSNSIGVKHQMTVTGQQILVRTLPDRLMGMNVPQSVKDTLKDEHLLRECPQALIKEGDADGQEPSWPSVGQAILQTFFQQAHQRAWFMHSYWVVSTREYLEEIGPLLTNHPQAGMVHVAGGERNGGDRPFIHPKTGDNRYLEMAQLCRHHLSDQVGSAMFFRFLNQRPQNGDDLAMMEPLWNDVGYLRVLGQALIAESPYHPLGPACVLRGGGSNVLSLLPPDHEQRYAAQPIYLYEYGQWLLNNQRMADAGKMLNKLVKINPNSATYESLAAYYLRINNRTKWEETLLASLKLADSGLQPASVRLDLADYYAEKMDWEKAKTYAGEAAETYAEWALNRASDIFARAGDFESAENYSKNASHRYSDSLAQWFRWCMRYDRGNKTEAFGLIKNTLNRQRTLSPQDNMLLGFCYETMNQPKEAVAHYTKVYAGVKNLDVAVRSAILEADQGNKEARDSWLIKALTPDKSLQGKRDYDAQFKIAELIQQSYKSGKIPDIEAIEEIVANTSERIRPAQFYLLGRLCDQLKDTENARSMYYKGMLPRLPNTWIFLLSEIRLRELAQKK